MGRVKTAEYGHLSGGQQRDVYLQFIAGTPVKTLARKYGLSTQVIDRVIAKRARPKLSA